MKAKFPTNSRYLSTVVLDRLIPQQYMQCQFSKAVSGRVLPWCKFRPHQSRLTVLWDRCLAIPFSQSRPATKNPSPLHCGRKLFFWAALSEHGGACHFGPLPSLPWPLRLVRQRLISFLDLFCAAFLFFFFPTLEPSIYGPSRGLSQKIFAFFSFVEHPLKKINTYFSPSSK